MRQVFLTQTFFHLFYNFPVSNQPLGFTTIVFTWHCALLMYIFKYLIVLVLCILYF